MTKHTRHISVQVAQLPESHTIWFFLDHLQRIIMETQGVIWLHIKAFLGLPWDDNGEE